MGSSASKRAKASQLNATIALPAKQPSTDSSDNTLSNNLDDADDSPTRAGSATSTCSSKRPPSLDRTFTKEDFALVIPPAPLQSQPTYAILAIPRVQSAETEQGGETHMEAGPGMQPGSPVNRSTSTPPVNDTLPSANSGRHEGTYLPAVDALSSQPQSPMPLDHLMTSTPVSSESRAAETRPSSSPSSGVSRAESFSNLPLELDVGGALVAGDDDGLDPVISSDGCSNPTQYSRTGSPNSM